MKITEKIIKFLNRNNPELISDEIAHVFHERKENGEKDPMDNTVKDIMRILKEHPDIKRAILANIAENEEIPDKLFEKTAIKISESEEIPDSVITDVVQRKDTNISDESINRIIEEGNISVNERINLIKNVEDEQIIEENVKNELKILYKVCKEKKDYEVVERVEKLKELLNDGEVTQDILNLIRQVVSKKMAENYYSDIKKGTRIFELSKIMPVEDMIEYDLPSMVEQEYKKIEENEGDKEGRFSKKELKKQILIEMGKNISYKYDETGVFIIPQSENMKGIDKEEEETFIKSIQTYSRKQLSKQEIIDIDEQIRGDSNNVQIKENMLINSIKNIPEKNKRESIDILSKIVSNSDELETISMLEDSGMIDKLNKMSKEKREKTIEIIENTLDNRKKMKVVTPPKIQNQQLKINTKEPEGR